MKLFYITVACLILTMTACSSPVIQEKKKVIATEQTKQEANKIVLHDEIQPAVMDTVCIGDLNNDQISDTAFIYTPQTIASVDQHGQIHFWNDCVDHNCYNLIRFSAPIPAMKKNMSVWGALQNAGDLDEDGFTELLFTPGWFTSSWTHLCLYSLKNNKWKKLADVTTRRDESLQKHIIQRNGSYFLKGIRFVDADDKPYFVKIPLEVPSEVSAQSQKSDTIQKL